MNLSNFQLTFNDIVTKHLKNIEHIKELKLQCNVSYGISLSLILIIVITVIILLLIKIMNKIQEKKIGDVKLNEILKKCRNK